jgi:hypothetical protein
MEGRLFAQRHFRVIEYASFSLWRGMACQSVDMYRRCDTMHFTSTTRTHHCHLHSDHEVASAPLPRSVRQCSLGWQLPDFTTMISSAREKA